MVSKNIHAENRSLPGIDFVAEQLGLGIMCCEVALSSGSAATWGRKMRREHMTSRSALCIGSGFPVTTLIVSTIESST